MSEILQGESIQVVAYDPADVVITVALNCLRDALESCEVEIQLTMADRLEDMQAAFEEQPTLGLAFWSIKKPGEAKFVVSKLLSLSNNRLVKIVYLTPEIEGYAQVLNEAGAQIVANELPSLQRFIRNIAPRIPRSNLGTHPLTTGLSQRLPWSELD